MHFFCNLKTAFISGLALAALAAGEARAQNTIRVDVGTSPELIAAFKKADSDPTNKYDIWLARRQDANGNVVKWTPTESFTLTKGIVEIHGSTSLNYPERYVFDGQGARRLFNVVAAAGFKPRLRISGITVQNGVVGFGENGGGLYAYGAGRIELTFCRFVGNQSNQPGSGIAIYNTDYALLLHLTVDKNINDQWASCGNGETGNGGGVAIVNTLSPTIGATISQCSFINNKACRGAGLDIKGNVNFNLVNSTLAFNEASVRGGGLYIHAGSGSSLARFNTIAYNKGGTRTESSQGRFAGGLLTDGYNGAIKFQGNIIAKNTVANPQPGSLNGLTGDDCWTVSGSFGTSYTYETLVGKPGNCGYFGNPGTNYLGTENNPFNPKISPTLEANRSASGFALPVLVPFADSPVRGNFRSASDNPTESYDQRGYARDFAPTYCDIGAVEFGAGGLP
jgi:hypothetical protein